MHPQPALLSCSSETVTSGDFDQELVIVADDPVDTEVELWAAESKTSVRKNPHASGRGTRPLPDATEDLRSPRDQTVGRM